MKFRGLRTSIALDLIVLLGIAMLLLNFVIVALWQQFALRQAIDQAGTTLDLLVAVGEQDCTRLSDFHLSVIEMPQGNIRAFAIFQNGTIHPAALAESETLAQTVKLAGYTGSEMVETHGSIFSFFGPSSREVIIAKPLSNCGGRDAMALVIELQTIQEAIFAKQSYIFVYILVNILVLATVGFFRLRKLIITPVENLVSLSESFRGDNDDMLALTSGKSEFGHIALALHGMLSKIERDKEKLRHTIRSLEQANEQILTNQASLIEAEKLAAVGRLSAGLAHEIGNPLGIIQGYIELLGRSDVTLEERQQYTSRAAKELTRMINLLQQLMNIARKPREESSRCSVTSVIDEVVEMLRYQKSTDTIRFQLDCEEIEEEAHCSAADLHQVLLNCLLNAVDAINERQREGDSGEQGLITLITKKVRQENKDCVKIVLEDNGRGVREADLSSVFEPFFTTKEVGQGTGLGLAVSRTIVENSGGTIRLESINGSGARVMIILPVEKRQNGSHKLTEF